MAISTQLRNQTNEDTVHATVRCDKQSFMKLKQFMHCKAEIGICFPYGVRLLPRGRGWYRLEASSSTRAFEKVVFALKTIKRFVRELEQHNREIRIRTLPLERDPDLRIVSFSAYHSDGEYGYAGTPQLRPATKQQLSALAAKFAK